VHRADWRDSVYGVTAIWNCLCLNLFEKILASLPKQAIGVYLQENQGWEMALLHAWRTSGHGALIGVAHTTVPYWYLGYFFDPRSYAREGRNHLPMPDRVALNGEAAFSAYRAGGYPSDQVVEVEALRYLYLAGATTQKRTTRESGQSLCVLVCGDLVPDANQLLLEWLDAAACSLATTTRYIVKPHPSCAIDPAKFPNLGIEIRNEPLQELFPGCDIVLTSNATSAAVDAYCSGLPVIAVLDGQTLNMSPLRQVAGVFWASSAAEVTRALLHFRDAVKSPRPPYFCLDQNLPRWRGLLGLEAGAAGC
jgi:surface carbohydrate biosynthesis protein (TIGR04326 family)